MGDLKTCRICLNTEVKLFKIESDNLEDAYENLTGTEVLFLPPYVCFECAALLKKYSIFREKALVSQSLLLPLLDTVMELRENNLRMIDREAIGLSSSVSYNNIELFSTIKGIAEIRNYSNDTALMLNNKGEQDTDENGSDTAGTVTYNVNGQESLENCEDTASVEMCQNLRKDESDTDIEMNSDTESLAPSGDLESPTEPVVKFLLQVKDKTIPLLKRGGHRKKKSYKKYPIDLYERFATVVELTHEEQVADVEKRKESHNYKMSLFTCDLCYRGFSDEGAFKTHLLKHDPVSGEFECDLCHFRFFNRDFLVKHIGRTHRKKFLCKQCPHYCMSPEDARKHEQMHRGVTYKCKYCDKEFNKWSTLLSHVRIGHPATNACELCGDAFLTPQGVFLHKVQVHRTSQITMEENAPYCEVCDVKFASEKAWKRHFVLSGKHNFKEMVNTCKICGETFASEDDLRDHRNVHPKRSARVPVKKKPVEEGIWPVKCEQCDKIMHSAQQYKFHFISAHRDKNRTVFPQRKSTFMCETCGKVFGVATLLRYHQRIHTGNNMYKCELCPKTYPNKRRMEEHRWTHTGEKPFACCTCGRKFNIMSNLRRHELSHLGKKPHKCDECGKGFLQPSDLKSHVKYVHLKVPWPKRNRKKRDEE